jgi:hypothetical protein
VTAQDSLTAGFFAGGLKFDPYGRTMSEVRCREAVSRSGDLPHFYKYPLITIDKLVITIFNNHITRK